MEVTATLSPQCIRHGLNRVSGCCRLHFALDQRLDLVSDFGSDLRFPEPIEWRDAVLEPRGEFLSDGVLEATIRGGQLREGLKILSELRVDHRICQVG